MGRPRWHDVLIIGAITGLLAVGVWALWWEDVRAALGIDPPAQVTDPVPAAIPRSERSRSSRRSNPGVNLTVIAAA
jgi:hypothetical protein